MIEVTRVLGNLSRSKDVRDYILEIGGMLYIINYYFVHFDKNYLWNERGGNNWKLLG